MNIYKAMHAACSCAASLLTMLLETAMRPWQSNIELFQTWHSVLLKPGTAYAVALVQLQELHHHIQIQHRLQANRWLGSRLLEQPVGLAAHSYLATSWGGGGG
jgi:hypothetical protein